MVKTKQDENSAQLALLWLYCALNSTESSVSECLLLSFGHSVCHLATSKLRGPGTPDDPVLAPHSSSIQTDTPIPLPAEPLTLQYQTPWVTPCPSYTIPQLFQFFSRRHLGQLSRNRNLGEESCSCHLS
jgi:hypothetical protein